MLVVSRISSLIVGPLLSSSEGQRSRPYVFPLEISPKIPMFNLGLAQS